jgi:ADP-ribose pyrophosphatase YjhB (NUDIX family)
MNQNEIKNAVNIIDAVEGIPRLPEELFFSILKKVPMTVVELFITQTGKDYLLTWRDDKDFHGWHIPGGFLGYGESWDDACQRIAMRELGTKLKNIKFRTAISYAKGEDPRGHITSLLFTAKLVGKPQDGTFYTKNPKETLGHVNIIKKALKFNQ